MPYSIHALPDADREPAFYAGVTGKRFIAWVVDAVVIFALTLLALPFTAFTGIFFFGFLFLVIGFVYRWITIARRSSTWGMRLMAIELRNKKGERLDGLAALLHVAGYSITLAVTPLVFVSAALMIFRGRGQGLTDLVLNTAMINKPAELR